MKTYGYCINNEDHWGVTCDDCGCCLSCCQCEWRIKQRSRRNIALHARLQEAHETYDDILADSVVLAETDGIVCHWDEEKMREKMLPYVHSRVDNSIKHGPHILVGDPVVGERLKGVVTKDQVKKSLARQYKKIKTSHLNRHPEHKKAIADIEYCIVNEIS